MIDLSALTHIHRQSLTDWRLQEGDPAPKSAAQQVADTRKSVQAGGNSSVAVYAVILVGAAVAFFAYQYLQQSQNKS